jgi:hypothetical protein
MVENWKCKRCFTFWCYDFQCGVKSVRIGPDYFRAIVSMVVVISAYQRSGTMAFGQAMSRAFGLSVLPELFLDKRTRHDSFFSFWTQLVRSGKADCYPCYSDIHLILRSYFNQLENVHGRNIIAHVKADQYAYVPFLVQHLRDLETKFICLYRKDNLARLVSCAVADARVACGYSAHDTKIVQQPLNHNITVDPDQFVQNVRRDTQNVRAFVELHRAAGDVILKYEDLFDSGCLDAELQRIQTQYGLSEGQSIVDSDPAVVRSVQRPEDLFSNYQELVSQLEILGSEARFVDIDL